MAFRSYISLYFASSKDSPIRRYSRILQALLPLISDTVPDNLMLAPSAFSGDDSVLWCAHPQGFCDSGLILAVRADPCRECNWTGAIHAEEGLRSIPHPLHLLSVPEQLSYGAH